VISDSRFAVRRYLALGWKPLPIPKGEKGPRVPNWQNTDFTEAEFGADDNVGIRLGDPSGGLVDIDLDCMEAVKCARSLLLSTQWIFGRKSKPASHYLYTVPGMKAEQFKDVDGSVLVEIRSTGGQTVFPPSTHPSGESIEAEIDKEASKVEADMLRLSAALVATCALLARRWPKGSRHIAARDAAGFLASRDIEPMLVEAVIGLAAEIAGDNEVSDRKRVARDSVEQFKSGGKTTGLPSLRKVLGDEVVKSLCDWFGGEQLSRIEEANERFAVLSVGSNRVVAEFDETESVIELWKFDEFKKLLIKEPRVSGGKASKPFADFWLEHPKGRQYNRLVYVMPGSRDALRPGDFNGYHGFTVEPQPGDWSLNRAHIHDVICGGDPAIFAWVLNWLAALFQKPGQHAWSAVVMRGGQGVGKGHFADVLIGKCFHPQQYLHIIGANQLTAEFNEHLSGKVLVFADESTWGGDPKAAAKIKGLVTEDTVPIHRKFLKLIDEPSALHILIASNSEWPIPIDRDDRRFLVLDVHDDRRQDQHYFGTLRAELEAGGRAAMLHELLNRTVDWPLLRQPPETDAKRDVKERTLSAEERWLQDWLMNDDDMWQSEITKTAIYGSYVTSVPKHLTPKTKDGFGKFLRKVFKLGGAKGWPEDQKGKADPVTKKRPNVYRFPDLETCRRVFDNATGTRTEWPGVQFEVREAEGDAA
jgi:hypothetical protein